MTNSKTDSEILRKIVSLRLTGTCCSEVPARRLRREINHYCPGGYLLVTERLQFYLRAVCLCVCLCVRKGERIYSKLMHIRRCEHTVLYDSATVFDGAWVCVCLCVCGNRYSAAEQSSVTEELRGLDFPKWP